MTGKHSDNQTGSANTGHVNNSGEQQFPVIGIGASAGGLAACKAFLKELPADAGVAVVAVLHLDPTHKSMLAELLGNISSMQVCEAAHGMQLQPNSVYVIPPNEYLSIDNGRLQLQPPIERRGLRMPVDFFFRSLAESHGERAIAVVLSGTGSDGTQGIRCINEAGGLILAETAESCEFSDMPASAIRTGLVDLELPPEQMAAAILDYSGRLPASTKHALNETPTDDLSAVLALLHARTHFDFRAYKPSTLMRRMRRRMNIGRIEKISTYMQKLRIDDDEIRLLVKDFLIGVTAFFRDPDAYAELEHKVLPELLRNKNDGDTVRVWVAGCSTGEEAYSLAILLIETIEAAGANLTPVIFGTDIDADALVTARKGLYPASVVAGLGAERLARFFDQEGLSYRVTKQLRARVVFAEQNLVVDPPFSKMDIVSCRNLLIYFNSDLQQRALALMHFALNDTGYLFLGSSESIKQQTDLFEPLSKKWRLFRRLAVSGRSSIVIDPLRGSHPKPLSDEIGLPMQLRPALADRVIGLLLKRFAPASVLINRSGEILYYHGDTQLALRQQYGQPTNDLFALARGGLAGELRKMISEALETNRPQVVSELPVDDSEEEAWLRITAAPVIWTPRAEQLLLISFEPIGTEVTASGLRSSAARPDRPELTDGENKSKDRELERVESQRTISMLENANLELKTRGMASDERVTTLSEEFQSTTEELETSREELQSLNEELNTVNGQLQEKVSDLETVNDDLTNLIRSSSLIVLFLDRQFHIKRYTPASTELFRLIPSDIGRPIIDISHRLQVNNLVDVATEVLEQLEQHVDEVQADDGHWYLRRVLPYRTEDDRISGVVLTLTDIHELKLAEASLRQMNELVEDRAEKRLAYLLLLKDIALEVNQAVDLKDALREVLARICAEFHWPLAHAFLPTDDDPGTFAATEVWLSRPVEQESYQAVIDASSNMRVTANDGLLGTALRERQPQWCHGFNEDRKMARARGLPTGAITGHVIIPLLAGGEVGGLLEFFTNGDESLQTLDQQANDAMIQVGTLVGAMVTRAKASAEHKRHEAEMAHASRVSTLGELGSSLAHELSQPLSAISNYIAAAQMAHGNKDPAQLASLLEGINEQVNRTSTIMSGLRDFVAQRNVTRERCDVEQLIHYTLKILSNKIKQTGVTIEVQADENLPGIHATAIQIEQVLVNLLVNALDSLAEKHDAERRIVIEITQHNDRGLQPAVDITVTDNGGGISAKVESRLFKALATTKTDGMGLGLFVSNSIVEAHGGTLRLTRSNAEGSSFTVSLPTIPDVDSPANNPVDGS